MFSDSLEILDTSICFRVVSDLASCDQCPVWLRVCHPWLLLSGAQVSLFQITCHHPSRTRGKIFCEVSAPSTHLEFVRIAGPISSIEGARGGFQAHAMICVLLGQAWSRRKDRRARASRILQQLASPDDTGILTSRKCSTCTSFMDW